MAIDPALHAPARLQIAAALSGVDDVEFVLLREVTGVSDSVLSKHLAALADINYVKLTKAAKDGRQRTWASFTTKGRKAFAGHMRALRELMDQAQAAVAAE